MKINKTIKESTWWNVTNINYNMSFDKMLRYSVPTRSDLQSRQYVHVSFGINKGSIEQNIYVSATVHVIPYENK